MYYFAIIIVIITNIIIIIVIISRSANDRVKVNRCCGQLMVAGVTGPSGVNAVKLVELEYVNASDAATLQVQSLEVDTVVASSPRDGRVN